jgi:uncharacterized membrane protein
MVPGLWISVVALLAGYFVCPSGTNTHGPDWSSVSVKSANHSNNNNFETLGESPYRMSMDNVLANDSSDPDAKHHGEEHHGIHVANWRWDEIGVFFTFAVFIIVSGLAKVGKLLRIYYIYYGSIVLICTHIVSIIFGTLDHFKQLMYFTFCVLNMFLFLFFLAFHYASHISEHIPESW